MTGQRSRATRAVAVPLVVLFAAACADREPTAPTVEDATALFTFSSVDCSATVSGGESIQDAIDDAAEGDTICVEAGTYSEDLTIPLSDLALMGAKHGVPAGPDADPEDRGSGESIIEGVDATLAAVELQGVTGFVLDGFTIRARTAVAQSAVYLRGASHIIRNNIMDGATFGPAATGSGQFPSGVRSQNFSDVLVEHNNIQDFRYGMNLDGGAGNQQSTIDNNYLSGSISSTIFFQGSGANGHIVTNNLVEANGGIGLILTQGEHLVQGNTIQDNGSAGIWLVNTARTQDVEILDNRIFNNVWGIFQSSGVAGVNFAHGNCIDGNSVGVRNDDNSHVLDATGNWWGDASGPTHPDNLGGTGDSVEGNVAFDPWLVDGCPLDEPEEPADPESIFDCMSGGWEAFGFRNQGQCIRFVNTGQDSR